MNIAGFEINAVADVDALDGKALLKLYNHLTGKETKKFASRKKGLAQTKKEVALELKARAKAEGEKPAKEPAAKGEKSAKVAKTARRMQFRLAPLQVREVRETSKRYSVIQMLKRPQGATFQEVMDATGWNERQTYEGIRLVHFAAGHGLWDEVDADGSIRIRTVDSLDEFRKLAGAKSAG